nr:hypothetical protein [Tanacetum cinerariifolium]
MCDIFCQSIQKKREEKRIEEEQAAKAKYWKLPVCYDDDDDEERSDSLDDNIISGFPSFSAITPDEPVLSTEEPDNSLSMWDEHLDTIPATESDEFIKSGVENLIPILSESEGIPEHNCDVPSHDNSLPLDVSKDTIEDFCKTHMKNTINLKFSFTSEDFDFKDSIDQSDLANYDDLFVDPTPEMFTDEQPPDYSFPPRFDVYPDDFLEIESDATFDNDSFDSKGEKIKEAELLIYQLDLPYDILSEYDSFNS